MSDLTEIKRISDTTGATFSDAKNAYYEANGDYALAVSNISGGSYGSTGRTRMAYDASSWFEKFLASELTLFTREDKSVSLPLIMAAVISLVCIEFIVPVVIIAFLAGVGYKFSGPVFKKDIVLSFRNSENNTKTETARAYDYREEFRKQEARRKEQEAQRAQSVKYEMPPRYEAPKYDYNYAYSSERRTESDPNEEKGFF